MRAIVIFADLERPRWWRRFLRPGFRHCLVLVETPAEDHWIEIDPLAHHTRVRLHRFVPDDLDTVLDRATATVEVYVPDIVPKRGLWLWPATCVETVKRVIGLRSYWTITPYQLYRRITGQSS